MKNSSKILLFLFFTASMLSLDSCVVRARPAAVVVKPAPAVVVTPVRPARKRVVIVKPHRHRYHHRTVIVR